MKKIGLLTGLLFLLFAASGKAETFVLPAGTREIGEEAFAGIAAEEIVIPESVIRIGARAFAGCTGLRILRFEGYDGIYAENMLEGCKNVMICVRAGSAAEDWANRCGYKPSIDGDGEIILPVI